MVTGSNSTVQVRVMLEDVWLLGVTVQFRSGLVASFPGFPHAAFFDCIFFKAGDKPGNKARSQLQMVALLIMI